MKTTHLIIALFSVMFLVSCSTQDPKTDKNMNPIENDKPNENTLQIQFDSFKKNLDSAALEKLNIDIATRVLRKPDAATWQTKYNVEFREYFEKKAIELEWIYSIQQQDTIFFYLIRDGRDNNGKANRGVGGKMVLDNDNEISYFVELFVTKIIDRINLERIGREFLSAVQENGATDEFIEKSSASMEWPDGRLFYSVEKSEWRYVD